MMSSLFLFIYLFDFHSKYCEYCFKDPEFLTVDFVVAVVVVIVVVVVVVFVFPPMIKTPTQMTNAF